MQGQQQQNDGLLHDDTHNNRRDLFGSMSKEERNEAIGIAIDAWLDKKWASFSKWTIRGIGAALLAGATHLIAQHWNWN